MKRLKLKYLELMVLMMATSGCSLPYLTHVSKGQLSIMHHREKIEEAISKQTLTPQQKNKLELVLDVRKYAIENLGLANNQSYTKFVDLHRDSVAFNLVVCPKDSLESYSWWFPFVGKLYYLGFFDKDYALKTKKEYEEDGYDTYLRGVSAYSTLGWFDDPVFSTMLSYRDDALANLIIHELTHATIYKKGDTNFNEGIATFVGNRGSLDYLIHKYGVHSKAYQDALQSQQDDLVFSEFMKASEKTLNEYYARPVSSEEKIKERDKKFLEIKQNFLLFKPKFKTNSYKSFDKLDFNNAVFVAFSQYYGDLSFFENAWKKNGKNLKATIESLK